MKRAVVILSVLLLLVSLAMADEKCSDNKGKTECSKTCKLPKGATGCVETKADMKVESGEIKQVSSPEQTATAKTTETPAAPETGKPAIIASEAHAPEHVCGEKTRCIELDQFHAAMHPMALAMGFEGDEKPDMAKFRSLYPKMKERTDALAKMPVDDKGMKDPKLFTKERAELVKLVDELGAACKGKDDSKIGPSFEKVHEAYIKLAMMVK